MGESIGSRSERLDNPALKVELLQGGQPVTTQWLFGKPEMKKMMEGMMHARKGPFTSELMRVEGQAPNWTCVVALRDSAGRAQGEYRLAVGQRVEIQGGPESIRPVIGDWACQRQSGSRHTPPT